jgi:hypothetical protein
MAESGLSRFVKENVDPEGIDEYSKIIKMTFTSEQEVMFSTAATLEIIVSALGGIRPSVVKVLKQKPFQAFCFFQGRETG